MVLGLPRPSLCVVKSRSTAESKSKKANNSHNIKREIPIRNRKDARQLVSGAIHIPAYYSTFSKASLVNFCD